MFVLKPSPIQGVGVFTTRAIAEGEHLDLWPEEDWRFVPDAEAARDPQMAELGETYCVRDSGGWRCPLDFRRMSIGWYMNHSDRPNARPAPERNYHYFAARDISAGEEIVCDYSAITPYEHAPGAPEA